MDSIPSISIPPAASTARIPAEQGERAGSPDATHPGGSRFSSILKSAEAGKVGPAKGGSSAQGDRRAANAGKETEGDGSAPPSLSAAAWSSVALAAPNDSRPCAGVVAPGPEVAGSAGADPVPVPAGAATLPAEGDPLLKPLSSWIHPAAADAEKSAAPSQSPGAGDPTPVSASPTAAATLPAEGDPFLKPLSSLIHPAAADGEKNGAPPQAPGAGDPMPVSSSPTAAASEPNDASSAKADGASMNIGNVVPPPEEARGAEGIRKRKDDASERNEGQAEPVATPTADGNRGVAERTAAPRPVGPASDPGVARFDEKAFVITRKGDTSVEVTLAPPGVGRLEIEVVLEKGVVNARIIAADSAGREAIARSLPQIVETLARDGMNIGGFTVSLKERRDRTADATAHGASRDPDARLPSEVTPAASASAASAGLVDIFV